MEKLYQRVSERTGYTEKEVKEICETFMRNLAKALYFARHITVWRQFFIYNYDTEIIWNDKMPRNIKKKYKTRKHRLRSVRS